MLMQNQNFNTDELKVQEYIIKYIKELQRHFDVPNRRMRIILYKIYKELSVFSLIKNFVKKQIDMVKSDYIKNNKKKEDD